MVEKSHTAGWWPHLYEPLRGVGQKIADWFAPRAEAAVTNDFYEINMELPGVSVDDIEISLDEGQLTIKGEKRFAREASGRSYYFSEREYGALQRSFRLPAAAKSEDVAADFKDGILAVKVPKAGPPPKKTQRIEITAA